MMADLKGKETDNTDNKLAYQDGRVSALDVFLVYLK